MGFKSNIPLVQGLSRYSISLPPSENNLISGQTIRKKKIDNKMKEYYKCIVKYLDEHLYFLWLRGSDPFYGLDFTMDLPFYVYQDISLPFARILYFKRFPDHTTIEDPVAYLIAQEDIKNNIFD